jgi:AraC family L-rhamnose operon transcriptional activator RhaR
MAQLAAMRAETAAVRLRRADDPVAAVGASVGWGDPNYFSRRFRAHFGMSPTDFRRAYDA